MVVLELFRNVSDASPTGTIMSAYQKNVGMALAASAATPNPTAPPSR